MQALCKEVIGPTSQGSWNDWDKATDGHQGVGRGSREDKQLVVAVPIGPLLPPLGDILGRVQNISKLWLQLTTIQLTRGSV